MFIFINIIRWIYYTHGSSNGMHRVTFDGKENQEVFHLETRPQDIEIDIYPYRG